MTCVFNLAGNCKQHYAERRGVTVCEILYRADRNYYLLWYEQFPEYCAPPGLYYTQWTGLVINTDAFGVNKQGLRHFGLVWC